MSSGRVGYVRSCFSRRLRAQVVPVDLLRTVCKSMGLAARLRRDFAGYLVTEPDLGPVSDWALDCDTEPMHYAEYVVCWHPLEGSYPVPPFSESRGKYSESFDYGYECMTGSEGCGGLDAPRLIAAGSMRGADYGGFASVVERHGLWV